MTNCVLIAGIAVMIDDRCLRVGALREEDTLRSIEEWRSVKR